MANIRSWLFVVGLIVAIVLGVIASLTNASSTLLGIVVIVLGLVAGFLNLDKGPEFLLAQVALLFVSSTLEIAFSRIGINYLTLANSLVMISVFLAVSAVVTGIKYLFHVE